MPLLGVYQPTSPPFFDASGIVSAVARFREPAHIIYHPTAGAVGVAFGGTPVPCEAESDTAYGWVGSLPALWPEWLGDRSFCATHGLRFPYVCGAMANGIGSTAIVMAMARAGMLGFFGSAGLSLTRIQAAVDELAVLGDLPYGCNLIHAPHEPHIEAGTVEIYLRAGVRRVEAAAFMALTAPLVRYAASGLTQGADGHIHRVNHIFAKVSRPEVARRFLTPPPQELLNKLVAAGELTADEARLAARLPVAEDVIVEADSGGHTDNRPLVALFPLITALRDELVRQHGYSRPIRVGAAGGLGTPAAVAAAFGMGAAFVLTGSVNQGAVESGTSALVREMLSRADFSDVAMAPAADMFEAGVEVQVLKRGTMFASRGHRLLDLYRRYDRWSDVPAEDQARVEQEILRAPYAEIWAECERFFEKRDPRQVAIAARDPHHQMALVFRWYLGMSSRWAIGGDASRAMDFQVWCGPAMGAFNQWVRGSFLAPTEARSVVEIALNLLEGAATLTRAHQLSAYGVAVPAEAFVYFPRPLSA